MQKRSLIASILSGLLISGCSISSIDDYTPDLSNVFGFLEPYQIDVQQGSVLSQEKINQLKPGMDKRQVRFIMGSPSVVDTLHPNRWDYVYTYTPGGGEQVSERIALFFEDDRLIGIEGDFRPQEGQDGPILNKEVVVDVPPLPDEEPGFLDRALSTIGIESDE